MSNAASSRPNNTRLGVLLIVASVFLMSIQDAVFKWFSSDLSLWQLFTLRGLLALPLFFVITRFWQPSGSVWRSAIQLWPVLRSAAMTSMFIIFYASISFLSLSSVAAGIYTGPIFVTLLSALLIGEPVGTRGWLAIATGFSGVLLILQPGSDAFSGYTLLPVLGGFLYAVSNIVTRSKCQNVTATALSLSLNNTMLLTGLAFSGLLLLSSPAAAVDLPFLLGGWARVTGTEWLVMAALALLVIAIGTGLAAAYQRASPPVVATFDYCYLAFVALWDYVIFSTPPTIASSTGILLIITAGLIAMRRPAQSPRIS